MANLVEILLKVRDEASAQLRTAGVQMQSFTATLKANESALKATAIAGGAVAATLGLMVKTAVDDETSIIRLSVALKNVGVSYDAVKGSLEATMAATARKTGISDEDQRAALQKLVIGTGDYSEALKRLPLALDLAAATGLDAANAARLLGRITDETSGVLTRYGITLKEGATATEALGEIQKKVGGTAEQMGDKSAGAMNKLNDAISETMESFGTLLLPVVNKVADALRRLAETVKEMPDWLKKVGLVLMGGAVAGGLVAGLGLLVLQVQKAITGLLAMGKALAVMQAFAGPAGIAAVVAGLGLVVAIDQLGIFKDKGVEAFSAVGDAATGMGTAVSEAVDKLKSFNVGGPNQMFGGTIVSESEIGAYQAYIKTAEGQRALLTQEAKTLIASTTPNYQRLNEIREQLAKLPLPAAVPAAAIAKAVDTGELTTYFDPIAGEWVTMLKALYDANLVVINARSAQDARNMQFELDMLKAEDDRNAIIAAARIAEAEKYVSYFDPIAGEWVTMLKVLYDANLVVINAQAANDKALLDFQMDILKTEDDRNQAIAAARIAEAEKYVTFFDPIAGEMVTMLQSELDLQRTTANITAGLEKDLIALKTKNEEELQRLRLAKEGFGASNLQAYIQEGGEVQLFGPGPSAADLAHQADVSARVAAELAKHGVTQGATPGSFVVNVQVNLDGQQVGAAVGSAVTNQARVPSG